MFTVMKASGREAFAAPLETTLVAENVCFIILGKKCRILNMFSRTTKIAAG